jgi:hypothetical protein
LAHVVSFLAYPDLLGTKKFGCYCWRAKRMMPWWCIDIRESLQFLLGMWQLCQFIKEYCTS